METLRETVAWALFNANRVRWENYRVASLAQLPGQERQTLLGEADAALAALGLDDLDAASARGVQATQDDACCPSCRRSGRIFLEAALTAAGEGEAS